MLFIGLYKVKCTQIPQQILFTSAIQSKYGENCEVSVCKSEVKAATPLMISCALGNERNLIR